MIWYFQDGGIEILAPKPRKLGSELEEDCYNGNGTFDTFYDRKVLEGESGIGFIDRFDAWPKCQGNSRNRSHRVTVKDMLLLFSYTH